MIGETRLLVVWCPDWAAVSAAAVAGLPPHTPVAVVAANRVVACSTPARAEGIRLGTRRRDAQSRCPQLVVFEPDPDRDARLFEPVAAAVEELAPGVEVVRPGVVAVPARGPVGYFGGAERAAERLIDQVAAHAGVECQVGVADGLFAALLAARRGVIVPPGGTPEFLAPLSVGELDQPADRFGPVRSDGRIDRTDRSELVDLLRRLGIRTLGAFAALTEREVGTRLGGAAILAHRLASGRADRPLDRRRPPPDLAVDVVLDPPADRVDAAAFAAKTAAQRLYTGLAAHGLACTRLAIHIQTEAGERRDRVWRCAEPLTLSGIVDRVRWQLDGWLRLARQANQPSTDQPDINRPNTERLSAEGLGAEGLSTGRPSAEGSSTERPSADLLDPAQPPWLVDQAPRTPVVDYQAGLPTAGVCLLRLVPEEVIDGQALQSGLWFGEADPSAETERAGRALVRVQGLLGPEGVCTAVLGGGRGPGDQVRLVPWGDERVPAADPEPPWPGRLPRPSPTVVPTKEVQALVTDTDGGEVGVTGRHLLTGMPERVVVEGIEQSRVHGWAGPWPVVERWWDTGPRRAVRLQLVLGSDEDDTETGVLLLREDGRWLLEGMYH
jgi:protein ImuB